ncbi:MAG: hypothetical protein HYT87_05515 [Nitrospirae bacterium]|nr:hypothetical protein [Nitrospirota bacterium]
MGKRTNQGRGSGRRPKRSAPPPLDEEFDAEDLIQILTIVRDRVNGMERVHRQWVQLRDRVQYALEMAMSLQRRVDAGSSKH